MKLPYSDLRIGVFGDEKSPSVVLARKVVELCQKVEPRFSLHVYNGANAASEVNRACGFFIVSGEDRAALDLSEKVMSSGTIPIIVGGDSNTIAFPPSIVVSDVSSATKLIVEVHRDPVRYSEQRADIIRFAGSFPERLEVLSSAPERMTYQKMRKLVHDCKVACIMDEFTWKSYSPEANMIQLVPENWRNQLDSFCPDLIFVESAWRGIDDKWTNVVHKMPDELMGILSWAKGHGVPTVFWNKEDPIHFDTFKSVASLFDFIFTYDFNCVQKYKGITGRDNAFFLPMAVQPRMFNPIEKYERKDAFCFAGSYYRRYPERMKDLDGYIHVFSAFKPVEIYDRQYGKNDPNYMMPQEYAPYIKGNLPYDQIDKAYKGYTVSINLNSIKQANSIARRVFELLACNTVTVSNYSYGVVKGFGDLVITSDNADVILSRLKKYAAAEYGIDKYRLAGLRKVFSENTYADRLAYICSKAFGHDLTNVKPVAGLIAFVDSKCDLEKVRATFGRFCYPYKRLFIVSGSLPQCDGVYANFSDAVGEIKKCDYIGILDSNDYYGEHYLEDLVYAFKYSAETAVGKGRYFALKDRQLLLRGESKPYAMMMPQVDLKRGMTLSTVLIDAVQNDGLNLGRDCSVLRHSALSTDLFNYCELGQGEDLSHEAKRLVSDLEELDSGFAFSDMQRIAESLKSSKADCEVKNWIPAQQLSKWCRDDKNIRCTYENGKLHLTSTLGRGEFVYYPIRQNFCLSDILMPDGKMELYFGASCASSIRARIAYFFYDGEKKKISSAVGSVDTNLTVDVPSGAEYVQLKLRIQDPGVLDVGGMAFSHLATPMPVYLDKGKILCLTNHYPSYDNLYRNGFVHSRIRAYAEHGVRVSVFEMNGSVQPCFREFEGIDVISGNADYLRFVLQSSHYRTVAVHFLDADMWKVLQSLPKSINIVVWSHGSDILQYTRRLFNYQTPEAVEKARRQSEGRTAFWKTILRDIPDNYMHVFVSNYLKSAVEQDFALKIPENKYRIIHNPINTELFRYERKDASLRYKLLSIRPFASRKYANDLTVACIMELAKRHDFDKFEITLIGDGPLFDETLAPLRRFKNVHISRTFLRQKEIYEYHRKNGIFLVPTREDTQGVSRDEAMSSGLVVVTNAVTAIPEFVDSTCGILSPEEDYKDMARQIGRVVDDPDLFMAMSKAAAERVRQQTASAVIIGKELELLTRK